MPRSSARWYGFRTLEAGGRPGGVAALAAILSGRLALHGSTAVVVCSSGNVDAANSCRALNENEAA